MLKCLTIDMVHDIAVKADAKKNAISKYYPKTTFQDGKISASPPLSLEDLAEHDAIPEIQALREAVSGLSKEERQELAALMWVGRDQQEQWEDALRHAVEVGDPEPLYIAGKSRRLGEWLRAGLSRITQ